MKPFDDIMPEENSTIFANMDEPLITIERLSKFSR